jgi:hypothetical protein
MSRFWSSAVAVSICGLSMLLTSISAADAAQLANASRFTIQGTRSITGSCTYSTQAATTATLAPGESAVEVRTVGTDPNTCTETWERGIPSAAELAAERIPTNAGLRSASATSTSARAATARRHIKAHASALYGGYVYARGHDAFGEVETGTNASITYNSNGSCDSGGVREAHWYWSEADSVQLIGKNWTEGVSCSNAFSSIYGDFKVDGESCHYEYNRTAVFGFPSGELRGYWPITGCTPANYAGFLTRTH